ncbi:hypothetical protein BGZ47_001836 [Haplosporangium gracile]|nr:hypothetical protein BGZ47_001836 [Haplosporangium gracile]
MTENIMSRIFTVFVVVTLLLAQFGLATTGDLVISGRHYRNPSGCYAVLSSDALIINDTPIEATSYSDKDCEGTKKSIPAGFKGKIRNIQSIYIA